MSGVLIILAAIPSVYFYLQYQKIQEQLKNPQGFAQEELNRLTAQIGKLIELPGDETPTLATVSDVDKLRDQPFFTSAQNGDKVLIFTNAKKAILYRPSSGLIIDVAPVTIGPTATPVPTPSPQG